MARFKTFTNGGSFLPGDMNSIEDDYEFAFSTYKNFMHCGARVDSTGVTSAATWLVSGAATQGTTGYPVISSGGNAHWAVFYLDPADLLANTRTSKLRLRASMITNANAPAINYVFGMYQATTGGATPTLSAVLTGSTVAMNAPAATSLIQGNSGAFNAPSAGFFVLGFTTSAAVPAGSGQAIGITLQVAQV